MRFQPYRGRPQEVKLLKLPTSVLSLNWHCSPSPRNALCVEIEVCNPSLPCFLELSNNFEMPWPPTTSNGRITIWGKLWIVLTFLQFRKPSRSFTLPLTLTYCQPPYCYSTSHSPGNLSEISTKQYPDLSETLPHDGFHRICLQRSSSIISAHQLKVTRPLLR